MTFRQICCSACLRFGSGIAILATIGCLPIIYHRPKFDPAAAASVKNRIVCVYPTQLAGGLGEVPVKDLAAIDGSISRYLTSHGFEVDRNVCDDQLRFALAAFVASRNDATDRELRELMIQIVKDKQCHIVAFPYIIPRPAEMHGNSARWDGVERSVPHDGWAHGGAWRGVQVGASLAIPIVSRSGQWILRSMGGLEMPVRAIFNVKEFYGHASRVESTAPLVAGQFYPRDDYLKDEQSLHEAVQLALHPWIRKADYPDDPTYGVE